MENYLQEEGFITNRKNVDSLQLLNRFVLDCKETTKDNDYYPTPLCCADIITAVYYYRKFPDVNYFIENVFRSKGNYFLLHWVRTTWDRFSKMTDEDLSNLVINQLIMVSHFPK